MSNRITTAVIMAAGRGTRLWPYTEEIPKCFLEVGNKTLIERSIETLQANGIEQIIVGCGHKDEQFHRIKNVYGLTLYKNEDFATTDSLYTMVLADPFITSSFLLLESDLLYSPEAIKILLEAEGENIVLASGFTFSKDEVYIEADANGQLVNMTKDAAARESAFGELVGISKISHALLKDLAGLVKSDPDWQKKKYESGLVEMAEKHRIRVELAKELVWCEIDNEEHLKRAKENIYPKIEQGIRTTG